MTRTTRLKRPTIRDVARLAGVSHTTVSFVINDVQTETISEGTRQRIQAAIAELDYHPSEAARTLSRKTSQHIGMVIPEANNAFHWEVVAGAKDFAERHGYNLTTASANFDVQRERESFEWLKQRRVDGLILSPATGSALHDDIAQLSAEGYPIVTLGLHDAEADNVREEVLAGERQALEHLVGLGHTRIGYIYGVVNHTVFGYRLRNCLAIQQELGVPVLTEWILRCGPTVEDGYHAARSLLATFPAGERPTALIVVNDLLASAAVAALTTAGVRIPDEMSVLSFDNTKLAQYTVAPPLTSVDYESYAMGEHAVRLILERLREPQRPRAQLEMRARLVVRQSTGPAPASSTRPQPSRRLRDSSGRARE